MDPSDLFDPSALDSFDRSDLALPPHLTLRPLNLADNKLGCRDHNSVLYTVCYILFLSVWAEIET